MTFNNYDHFKQSARYNLSVYLPKMTRSTTDRRNKLRKLGRKWKAHLKPRPLSNNFRPPHDLRNKRSVLSLGSIRDLKIHQVSGFTPVPSIKYPSVRFTHPTVHHVISALPTPISTASHAITEHPIDNDPSSVSVDFPGHVSASAIYKRRSRVTNTVLYEEIYNQLDGVVTHPRNSQILRRREERRSKFHRDSIAALRPDGQTNGKPWPVEGICGTNPTQPRTKSGLRALQYLSYHAPIQEEAFSDAEICKNTDDDVSRERHLQATLDQLNGPREDIDLPVRPTRLPGFYVSLEDNGQPSRSSYMTYNELRRSTLPVPEELSIGHKAKGKQPANRDSQQSIDWEAALQTVQQRASFPQQMNIPTETKSFQPNTAMPLTPDFPTTNRRTLQQSVALDLCLATSATVTSPAVTPRFPVLDQEQELRRRTILGGQQRDMALTPSPSGLKVPATLPRTFSIPRRGVGQASKPQINLGLPFALAINREPLSSRTTSATPPAIVRKPVSSHTAFPSPPATLAAFVAQATRERNDLPPLDSFASHHALQQEVSPAKPKPSRLALFKKIIAKDY